MLNFNVINPYPFVYHFRDPQGVCFSIIKGKTKSIVIDCGYGIFNIRELVESYLDTPYIVILTHGHMDHSSGAYLFDKVFVPRQDEELFIKHNSVEKRTKNVVDALNKGLIDESYDKNKYINMPLANYELIDSGAIIDLGDMHVEIISMEGHTKGSIGLLIHEHKLLFTGDAAISMIWMFLEESTAKETYIEMLKRVINLDFTHYITGHLMTVFDKKIFNHYLEVALDAKPENSTPVTFQNFERPNTYQYAKQFDDLTIGICYHPNGNIDHHIGGFRHSRLGGGLGGRLSILRFRGSGGLHGLGRLCSLLRLGGLLSGFFCGFLGGCFCSRLGGGLGGHIFRGLLRTACGFFKRLINGLFLTAGTEHQRGTKGQSHEP